MLVFFYQAMALFASALPETATVQLIVVYSLYPSVYMVFSFSSIPTGVIMPDKDKPDSMGPPAKPAPNLPRRAEWIAVKSTNPVTAPPAKSAFRGVVMIQIRI